MKFGEIITEKEAVLACWYLCLGTKFYLTSEENPSESTKGMSDEELDRHMKKEEAEIAVLKREVEDMDLINDLIKNYLPNANLDIDKFSAEFAIVVAEGKENLRETCTEVLCKSTDQIKLNVLVGMAIIIQLQVTDDYEAWMEEPGVMYSLTERDLGKEGEGARINQEVEIELNAYL